MRNEHWSRILRVQRNEPNFKAYKNTRICSAHFGDNDYDISKTGKRLLKKSAVPRIAVGIRLKEKEIINKNVFSLQLLSHCWAKVSEMGIL